MSSLALRYGVAKIDDQSYRSTGGATSSIRADSKASTQNHKKNCTFNNSAATNEVREDNENLASALSKLHLNEISNEAAKEETATHQWNLWGAFAGTNNNQHEQRTKKLSDESHLSGYVVHGTAKAPSNEVYRRNVTAEQAKPGTVLVPKRLSRQLVCCNTSSENES